MAVFDCEEFVDIPNYKGYTINKLGICKSPNNKILTSHFDTSGYLQHTIVLNNKKTSAKLHRLLALAFIPNPNHLPQINHIDGVKVNNSLNNLEWISNVENIRHAYAIGLANNTGDNNNSKKVCFEDVKNIKKRRLGGESLKSIAQDYPITLSAVCKITTGINWK